MIEGGSVMFLLQLFGGFSCYAVLTCFEYLILRVLRALEGLVREFFL